jgi:hypothetical protein
MKNFNKKILNILVSRPVTNLNLNSLETLLGELNLRNLTSGESYILFQYLEENTIVLKKMLLNESNANFTQTILSNDSLESHIIIRVSNYSNIICVIQIHLLLQNYFKNSLYRIIKSIDISEYFEDDATTKVVKVFKGCRIGDVRYRLFKAHRKITFDLAQSKGPKCVIFTMHFSNHPSYEKEDYCENYCPTPTPTPIS